MWSPVNLLSPVTATYLLQIFDLMLSGSLEEARRSWLALIVLFVSVRLCHPTVGRRRQLRSVLSVTPRHGLVEKRDLMVCDAIERVG